MIIYLVEQTEVDDYSYNQPIFTHYPLKYFSKKEKAQKFIESKDKDYQKDLSIKEIQVED